MRPAETEADLFWDDTLLIDMFAERYGWTEQEINDTSVRRIRALQTIWGIRAGVMQRKTAEAEAKAQAQAQLTATRRR